MADYGTATIERVVDEHLGEILRVVQADDVIGISVELLANMQHCPVLADGTLLLAGDPAYRYRPVRFACLFDTYGFPPDMLVCERVQ